ncbi:hypothetical protein H0H87_009707 [Tephrocybe sp. NHM501043]|nr:hypothetical protein H0H87_009707 [Tephrocybe sp. NHM501043]
MVAAVASAGALSFLAAGPDSSEQLRDGLRFVRAALKIPSGVPVPAGVGFLGFLLDKTEASDDPRIPAVLEEMPMGIWFAFGGDIGKHIAYVRAYDSKREHKTAVFVIVNSVEVGNEAGGHGAAATPPLSILLQAVLQNVSSGPVILAAGGISTGAQSASILAMGADGVVLGSRLLCTPECMYNHEMKQEILNSGLNATARSYAFDDVSRTRFWPEGIDGRAIVNDVLVDFEQGLDLETRLQRFDDAKAKAERGRMVVWAGAGIGLVNDEKDSATIVKEINQEAVDILKGVCSRPPTGPATILIATGEYHETINVTRPGPLTLLGQLPSSSSTSLAKPKFPLDAAPSPTSNMVHIYDTNFVHTGMDDAQSAVLVVAPSYNASLIGAGPTDDANAHTLFYADLFGFGTAFVKHSSSRGTDFLITLLPRYFQNVILANRACGGGIVAWKGTNLTDAPGNKYGAYISDSKIMRDDLGMISPPPCSSILSWTTAFDQPDGHHLVGPGA